MRHFYLTQTCFYNMPEASSNHTNNKPSSDYLAPQQVAASFSRAASHYAKSSDLQEKVARQLLERLDWMKLSPSVILDVGCGAGRISQALNRRYPKAHIYGADIAINMVRESRKRAPRWFSRQHFICADAAALPWRTASADLIISNLMLQWRSSFTEVIQEFIRLLKPDGVLLFSSFGPDTLKELRDSWAKADTYTHVNHFPDMHHLGDSLLGSGLRDVVMDADRWVRRYPDALSLMRELKSMGAHNITHGRTRSLTGKGVMRAMLEAYEDYRETEGLPATFEVVYGYGRAPSDPDSSKRP